MINTLLLILSAMMGAMFGVALTCILISQKESSHHSGHRGGYQPRDVKLGRNPRPPSVRPNDLIEDA